jgi:ABC-type lipoprotein export system ATPase subunit
MHQNSAKKTENEARASNGGYRYGNEYLIELRDVVKVYHTDAGDFPALKDVNLRVGQGEFVAVIGKSGSGKSTLINMLAGIDRPSSGEIYIGDTAVHGLKERQMAGWRGRNVGIVFQFFQLLPTLTVVENIMLPMDFIGMYSRRERRERAMHLLELVDVAEHADKLPTGVSGGQQQRVAIARALANDPPIIVADEPTGNLDSRTAETVFELFETLIGEGKTVLMVTHDDDQARRVMRTVVIADGEIVNEYLARALPSLSQTLLVEATRQLEPQSFAPGEPIVLQDTVGDHFYIITKGEVNVYLRQPDGHEIFVEALGPGQYFGEMALLSGGRRTATVRSSRLAGVEVVALEADAFHKLLDQSKLTREEIDREATKRSETQARVRKENGIK